VVDFHQNGNVATLHNLRTRAPEDLAHELMALAPSRKVTLVLPCLYSELETEALPRIVEELSKVQYLHRIVIGLDRASEEQFRHASAAGSHRAWPG